MQQRNWYNGLLKANTASELKRNLPKGKVSYERACEVLNLIGYKKVKDEIWEG